MFKDNAGMKGIVKIQLLDKEGNSKSIFQGNDLWEKINKAFKLDVRLPFITGRYTKEGVMYNTITTAGLAVTAKRLGGVTANSISHMAIGTGTGGTTTLFSEITTGGGARAVVTPTSQTTSTTGDTIRCTKTFEFTGTFAVTEEGLLNASSSGDLIAYKTFSAVNVANGDSLQITHDIVMSTT